jgi:hypothetical protein
MLIANIGRQQEINNDARVRAIRNQIGRIEALQTHTFACAVEQTSTARTDIRNSRRFLVDRNVAFTYDKDVRNEARLERFDALDDIKRPRGTQQEAIANRRAILLEKKRVPYYAASNVDGINTEILRKISEIYTGYSIIQGDDIESEVIKNESITSFEFVNLAIGNDGTYLYGEILSHWTLLVYIDGAENVLAQFLSKLEEIKQPDLTSIPHAILLFTDDTAGRHCVYCCMRARLAYQYSNEESRNVGYRLGPL